MSASSDLIAAAIAAFGKAYKIEVSVDEQVWREVYKTESGKGGTEVIRFAPIGARWVRLTGTKRATEFGYSLWEMKVFPSRQARIESDV